MDERRERELVLDAIQSAFILDKTKGNIIVYVGPHKTSLSGTDEPVFFDSESRSFKPSTIEKAISQFVSATEGSYVVLENPSEREDDNHPKQGSNNLPKLMSGRKINIAGPVTFPLWPTQIATTIGGHHLRSNQYLLVRVYNEEAARQNWGKAVVKLQKASEETGESHQSNSVSGRESIINTAELTMGKLLIIKGTEVSFYIPPTGIEVLADAGGKYARNAVTLERLEYCILLDESGNKRYVQGPKVVFPEPTETFVEGRNGSKKFKAIELNEISGIYIKVIAPYKDENGVEHKPGEEMFITGKEMMIYYPRAEHALIKYGDQEIHYAVAVPEGEGRYVLDRVSGKIELVCGPCMLLPDPRYKVIVRRVLDERSVSLWFPGNEEALEYNRNLRLISQKTNNKFISDTAAVNFLAGAPAPPREKREMLSEDAEFRVGDDFTRKTSFTKPRMITLDTKYDGAVLIKVWTGYAVLVVSKTGERRVVAGPRPLLLKYDETLEPVCFSTKTPKTADHVIETVYLRAMNNKVSDIVEVETRDLCKVNIKMSYRVNFEGDPNLWFNVENYVQFLCDHLRSIMKKAAKQYSTDEFYKKYVEIIRDAILGVQDEKTKERAGRVFEENGMKVYDVEVLDVNLKDDEIKTLLLKTQRSIIDNEIQIELARKKLELTQKIEDCNRREAEEKSATKQKLLDFGISESEKELQHRLATLMVIFESEAKKLESEFANQQARTKIAGEEMARERQKALQEQEINKQKLELRLDELKAEAEALVKKAEAIKPDLIAAMQSFSDKHLAAQLAESMSPLAILGGQSVVDVVSNLLKGSGLENAVKSIGFGPKKQ